MIRALGFAAAIALSTWACPSAQTPPDIGAQRTAMMQLAPMVGQWAGVADIAYPAPARIYQTERVDVDGDGLVLVIHTQGYANPNRVGTPLFNAVGVISYDDARHVYEYRFYNGGRAQTLELHRLGDGRVQFLNPLAQALLRNTISLTPNHWNEVVEASRDDGATWAATLEVNLERSH